MKRWTKRTILPAKHEAINVPINDLEEPWDSMPAWRCTRPDYVPPFADQGLFLGRWVVYGGIPFLAIDFHTHEGDWVYRLEHDSHWIFVGRSCAEGWCSLCADSPEEAEAVHAEHAQRALAAATEDDEHWAKLMERKDPMLLPEATPALDRYLRCQSKNRWYGSWLDDFRSNWRAYVPIGPLPWQVYMRGE